MRRNKVIRLADAFESFLKDRRARNLRAATLEDYRRMVGRFVEAAGDPIIDESFFADLPSLTRNYVISLQGGSLSDTSIQTYARNARVFVNWLCGEHGQGAPKLPLPKADEPTIDPLTLDELQRLIQACNVKTNTGARDAAIIRLLATTGIRSGELCSLRTTDAVLDKSPAQVRIGSASKGRRARTITIDAATRDAIQHYLDNVQPDPDAAWLFQSERNPTRDAGGKLTTSAIRQMLAGVAERAGIRKRVYPHLLRHSYGTLQAQRGAPTHQLQLAMGHSDPKTTMKYVHLAQNNPIAPLLSHLPSMPTQRKAIQRGRLASVQALQESCAERGEGHGARHATSASSPSPPGVAGSDSNPQPRSGPQPLAALLTSSGGGCKVLGSGLACQLVHVFARPDGQHLVSLAARGTKWQDLPGTEKRMTLAGIEMLFGANDWLQAPPPVNEIA